jgi:HPt (histidine-containing phosphotransfer) domain-containing protein
VEPNDKPVETESGGKPESLTIEGVDVTGGLRRVAGNERLFRSLLGQFVEKQGAAARDIDDALTKGDRAQAERMAHTVKGVAGNLGMAEVGARAAEVERAIRNHDESRTLLASLASALENQGAAIRRVLIVTPPEAAPAPFNREEAATALARLRVLIAANDGNVKDAFDAIEATLSGSTSAQHLEDLRTAIAAYDFDAAAVTLDQIARESQLA